MEVFGEDYTVAYDFLYSNKDYGRECDFIEAVFQKYSREVKGVLDLGCGTGGHALILARRGYQLVGVDRSLSMLKMAREKAEEADLPLEFVRGDITTIELQSRFDAVISMFAVMGYQTTNEAFAGVCYTASNHLKRGGVFVFDCWYGPAVLTERPAARVKEVKLNEHERIVRLTEPVLNTLRHTVETRFTLRKMKKDLIIDETRESHLMRFLFPQEVRYFLKLAGFSEVMLCPFPRLDEPLTEQDWNMAVIAKK